MCVCFCVCTHIHIGLVACLAGSALVCNNNKARTEVATEQFSNPVL